ncbi:tetratricopeptide repeat protein [Caminibacter sp.]
MKNRRDFLKLSLVGSLYILSPIDLKAQIIMKYVTFKEVYPKSFWKKSYFNWIILGTSIVVAGVVSYFTAGAGAPAAASGVSTVASWIGGGGAGSYMAGLSTVGSWFGGNAMLGAAILNGISLGTIGGTSGKVALSLASKLANISDMSLSGIASLSEDGASIYVFDIQVPKKIGDGNVKELVENLEKLNEKKQDAIEDKNFDKAKLIDKEIDLNYNYGLKLLEKELDKSNPNIENLIVLGIIAYKKGKLKLFYDSLETIDFYSNKIKNDSFLKYLWGIYYLSLPRGDEKALKNFQTSYLKENYVIEPVLAIISILGKDYYANKELIYGWVNTGEKNYDSDKYDGRGLMSLYYKIGTIAFINKDWKNAIKYYEKAYDELGWIGKILPKTKPFKKILKLYIAISYKHLGNKKEAKSYLEDVLDYCETNQEKKQYLRMYNEG